MRILQICSARSIGGGERHVIDLSNSLVERGHSIFAAVVPGAAIVSELKLPSGNVIEQPLFGSVDVASAFAISRYVRTHRIELIHAHVGRDYPIAAFASRLAGVPYLITRHVLFPMSRIHRRLLARVSFVVAPSNSVARNLRAQQIFPEEKIVTIRNGLNAASYAVRSAILRDEFVVGSIGSLDPVKGFDVLLRSAPAVLHTFPEARFVIAGVDHSSDRHHERHLRALIEELGLEDRVQLAGWSEDIRKNLAGFDIFVSASRSESFGYAIAEAMLSGVPVIATETEGAKEIVGETGNATLVPIEQPSTMSGAIIKLANDRSNLESVTGAARRHIEDTFSLEKMIDQIEALYGRVLSKRNSV